MNYICQDTVEVIECCVFVSVLPSSGLIYCSAVHTQNTFDFIDCINGMLVYYSGATQIVVCDNLKTAVTRPSRYEPEFTKMCRRLSDHYKGGFTAPRPYKPRDKAMVEGAVRIVCQQVFAPLRDKPFYSLKSLNEAITHQMNYLNDRPYKRLSFSRRAFFTETEADQLTPLPALTFTIKKSITATVQRNNHIQLSEDRHYGSVPFGYVGKKVLELYDNLIVEIYSDRSHIAIHQRDRRAKSYHTVFDHMPSNHKHQVTVKGWTQQDLLEKPNRIGENSRLAANHILSSSFYPEQNFKSCYGGLMLHHKYDPNRLEAACKRA